MDISRDGEWFSLETKILQLACNWSLFGNDFVSR